MRYAAFALPLAALVFAGNAAAQQQTAPAPVTVNSCTPELDNSNGPSVLNIPLSSTSSGIKIEFVNDSNKIADLINFDVNSNGQQFVIRDVGKFSPGISITHKYRNGAGQAFVLPSYIAPNITCTVASVRFADGTSWTKGQTQTAPGQTSPVSASGAQGALTASPARVVIDHSTESDLFLVTSADRVTAFKESDNCSGVATVFVAATGQSTATYSVKPIAPGSCMATITDEAGNTLSVPIMVR